MGSLFWRAAATCLAFALPLGAWAQDASASAPAPTAAKSLPWNSSAERPLTLPAHVFEASLVPGVRLAGPTVNPLRHLPTLTAELDVRYGLSDTWEYRFPLLLSRAISPGSAASFEHSLQFGIVGASLSTTRGPDGEPTSHWSVAPAAGWFSQSLFAERMAFVGWLWVTTHVGNVAVAAEPEASGGVVWDVHDRVSLELSATGTAQLTSTWSGERFAGWRLQFGGLQRPILTWHLSPYFDVHAAIGLGFNLAASEFVGGVGFRFHTGTTTKSVTATP